MGASLSAESRPRRLLGWVLVLTLAIAVMLWLAHPFSAPFGIDVDSLSKLANVAWAEVGGLSGGFGMKFNETAVRTTQTFEPQFH